jgi:hypothetical protein
VAECGQFPEGRLYPFAIPALAYANLGLGGGDAARARERIATLIELALPHVVEQVRPPGGDLARLEDFSKQTTFLSMFGVMVGCHRLLGGDQRYEPLQAAVCGALRRALERADGATIDSYPTYSWTFDTVTALLALRLRDRCDGGDVATPLLVRHLAWLAAHGSDPATGLPFSEQSDPRRPGHPPRGCDLSMRVCLLAQLDRPAAKALYDGYVAAFWSDLGPIAGFREWPAGHVDAVDIDSGPILRGIGMTASGIGIGSCAAVGDAARAKRLGDQLAMVDQLKAMLELADPGMAKRALGADAGDARYVSGFLYGDAMLFYATTWSDWRTADPAGK